MLDYVRVRHPIGCLTIAAARLAGALRVIACDVVTEPLRVAERLGAHEIVINGPDAISIDWNCCSHKSRQSKQSEMP